MKKIKSFLLILIISYSTCFSQTGGLFHILLSGEGEGLELPLTLSNTTTEFTGNEAFISNLESGSNKAFLPKMLYNSSDGKTYYNYQSHYQTSTLGQSFLLEYDPLYGSDVPKVLGRNPQSTEPHQVPSLAIINNVLYSTQETPHNVPLDVYTSGGNLNSNYFTGNLNALGTNVAYAQIIKEPDNTATIWHRGGPSTTYSIYTLKSTSEFSGFGSQVRATICSNTAGGDRHYPGMPLNGEQGNISWRLIARRIDTNIIWYRFYLIGTDRTNGYNDRYFNYNQSYTHTVSVDGLINDSQLDANFKYFDTGSSATQGYEPVAAFGLDGNFYAVTGHGDNVYRLVWFEGGTWQTRIINIPNITAIEDIRDGGLGNDGGVEYLLPFDENNIFIVAYINEGTVLNPYIKPHIFGTKDKGVTWVDFGDMIPEVIKSILGVIIPNNFFDIPANTNFPITFTTPDSSASITPTRKAYIKTASKGLITSFSPDYWPSVTPVSDMNEVSCLIYAEFDAANITKTGTNITAVTSIHGSRTMTPVSNPQWVSPNLIEFNGTNNYCSIPSTGLTGIGIQTVIAVVKCAPGANGLIFSCSDNTSGTEYLEYSMNVSALGNKPNKSTKNGSPGQNVVGQQSIDDSGLHIIVFTTDAFSKDGINIDGKWQFHQPTSFTLANYNLIGDSNNSISTINAVRIASRDTNSTDFFAPVTFAAFGWYTEVFSNEQLHKKIKFLANKFNITLQEPYEQ